MIHQEGDVLADLFIAWFECLGQPSCRLHFADASDQLVVAVVVAAASHDGVVVVQMVKDHLVVFEEGRLDLRLDDFVPLIFGRGLRNKRH